MDELTAALSAHNRELLVRAEEMRARTRASPATAQQYILLARMQTVAVAQQRWPDRPERPDLP
jgi:hypothetical protein